MQGKEIHHPGQRKFRSEVNPEVQSGAVATGQPPSSSHFAAAKNSLLAFLYGSWIAHQYLASLLVPVKANYVSSKAGFLVLLLP